MGRGGCQIERHHVASPQLAYQLVLGLELILDTHEAHQQAVLADGDTAIRNLVLLQQRRDLLARTVVNVAGAGCRDLQRRIVAIEVWQCVDHADDEHDEEE